MFLLGIFIYVVVISTSIALTQSSGFYFINFGTLFFVLFGVICVLLSSGYIKPFLKGFKYLVSSKNKIAESQKEEIKKAMDISFKASILLGVFGLLIGVLGICYTLESFDTLGPRLAMPLSALLNGVFLGTVVFYPAKLRIIKK